MDSFVEYYNVNKRNFKYTIKIAQNDLAENTIVDIERSLAKYNLVEMTQIKKTPIQKHPMDFPNVRDSEVYIFEVTLQYPVTPHALGRSMSVYAKINECFIAVYSENDPRLHDQELWVERVINQEEFKSNYNPFLGNPEKWDDEPAYGKEYNDSFLKTLADAKIDREKHFSTVTNTLIPEQKVDTETHVDTDTMNPYTDSVLNDLHRNKNDIVKTMGKKVTMMSKPAK